MTKEKNQKDSDVKKEKSQLSLDFDNKNVNTPSNLRTSKVVSINSIVDKQREDLVRDIIRNTKSF
jgi:hypothetical protein